MRNLQICLLSFVFLAFAATAGADSVERHVEEKPAASPKAEAVQAPASIGQDEQRPALGQLNWIEMLGLDAPMTLAAGAPFNEFGSGCYIGCYDTATSEGICGPGKIAEVLVTGPINNCGLSDLACKTTCDGPVVRCRYFALCGGGL